MHYGLLQNTEYSHCSMLLGEGNGTPLQYSCLENPMDRRAWWAAVHGVAKTWTRLRDFTFIFQFHALEKEMATHSSVLVWRIPGTGEPGGLPSMGSHRVGHDWSDLAAAAAAWVLLLYPLESPFCCSACQFDFHKPNLVFLLEGCPQVVRTILPAGMKAQKWVQLNKLSSLPGP